MRFGSSLLPYTILTSVSLHILLAVGLSSNLHAQKKTEHFEIEILPGIENTKVEAAAPTKQQPHKISHNVVKPKQELKVNRSPASIETAASTPTIAVENPTQTSAENSPSPSLPSGAEAMHPGPGTKGLMIEAPSYPERCKREKIEGVTEVAVEFRADGTVEKTQLKKSSEACPEFSAVSLKAAAKARLVLSSEVQFFKYATLPFRFRLNQ